MAGRKVKDRITVNPNIHFGKPCVAGTRISGYLLSGSHLVGRAKALIFNNLGYDISNPAQLELGLLNIADQWDVVQTMNSEYGTKYIVDGILAAPNGSEFSLRTVWITDAGETRARFVTAYPL